MYSTVRRIVDKMEICSYSDIALKLETAARRPDSVSACRGIMKTYKCPRQADTLSFGLKLHNALRVQKSMSGVRITYYCGQCAVKPTLYAAILRIDYGGISNAMRAKRQTVKRVVAE